MVVDSSSRFAPQKNAFSVGLPSRGTSALARESMGERAHATFEYPVSPSIKATSRLAWELPIRRQLGIHLINASTQSPGSIRRAVLAASGVQDIGHMRLERG